MPTTKHNLLSNKHQCEMILKGESYYI